MINKTPAILSHEQLQKQSKAKLIQRVQQQQEALQAQVVVGEEKDKKIQELTEQVAQFKQQQEAQTKKDINNEANKPSSKKPEWDKDGNPKKKNTKKKKRKKRSGCGNQSKSALIAEETRRTELDECPECKTDLTNRPGTDKPGRIVEDIDSAKEKTKVTEEIEVSKWCPTCKTIVSSKTESALPGSDFGLNTMIELAYLWIACALSLPKIADYVNAFKAQKISTTGISKMMIRLSKILKPAYEEILEDVKQGAEIWADETGWRVNGDLWWLWIFANKRSAYYWPDPHRGSAVVQHILGSIFYGILIVDGWHAYTKLICAKQTCMAHIFRKIRKFIEKYPQYRSIMQFYLKLRKIIKDGETLQIKRHELDELTFQRRLKALKQRIHDLLKWKNPNSILADVIKKVRRQEAYLLTFVEHSGAEHHNNFGEYIIRKGVIKRKMSGGSKSAAGLRAYATLQSIAMTCQLRGLSFHHFMKKSLVHYIRTKRPMLLSDYEEKMQAEKLAA